MLFAKLAHLLPKGCGRLGRSHTSAVQDKGKAVVRLLIDPARQLRQRPVCCPCFSKVGWKDSVEHDAVALCSPSASCSQDL